jgi:hypothetical protein
MADDADFTDEFCEFLQYSVTAVEGAEVLLALLDAPARSWMPRELAEALRPDTALSEVDIAKYLDLFHGRGLIARGPDGSVSYQTISPELDAHVRKLARLYNERPVTLIRVIYALRDTRIKSFADAFKIRRP